MNMKFPAVIFIFLICFAFTLSAKEHEFLIFGNRLFKPLSGKTILQPVSYIFADTDRYYTGGFGLSLSFYQFESGKAPEYNSENADLLFSNSLDSLFKLQTGVFVADALSIFLDEGGFQLDCVDMIYGVFADVKYRFITASIRAEHHCGNRSTGTFSDSDKADILYTNFYSLESIVFYIDAEIFRFRPYFGISFGKNLYGGGSEKTDPNNVINIGLEFNRNFNSLEWLGIFSALDFFAVSMNDFRPNTGITSGIRLKSMYLFIRYYNGINTRGVFYGNEEHIFSGGFFMYF